MFCVRLISHGLTEGLPRRCMAGEARLHTWIRLAVRVAGPISPEACHELHAVAYRPFVESNNKGPHFWDEQHPIRWYTDIFDPVAKAVESGKATEEGPLAVDASSNTFTISGVNVLGKRSRKVCITFENQIAKVIVSPGCL